MAKVIGTEVARLLSDVPEMYVFYLNDGRVLKNMEELSGALNSMSDELYTYHVSAEKNDFSKWVQDIIRDEKLAHDLLKTKNKGQAYQSVAQRVSFLTGKKGG